MIRPARVTVVPSLLGLMLGVVAIPAMLACASEVHAPAREGNVPPATPTRVFLPLTPTVYSGSSVRQPLCNDAQPPFITDLEVRQPAMLAQPAARVPFRDPVFGSCVVRVTDHDSDLSPDDESPGLKNEYARVQSFNADGTLILVYGVEGEWFLYDAATLQPLGQVPLGDEPRWDAQNPDIIYHIEETRLLATNVESGDQLKVREFAGDTPNGTIVVWTAHEGRPSRDSRYWGLMAEGNDWVPLAFLIYDRLADQVTVRDMRGVPAVRDDVDHVTISPLGTYFLASFDRYCEPGELGDDEHPCGLMVYDHDLSNGRSLLRIVGHYDPVLDSQGREVVIYQDIDTDHIAMLDLASGAVTSLFPIDFSQTGLGFHFSGLGYGEPGWALISTYSGGYPHAYTWMDDQIFVAELVTGGRVVRLAHSHSRVDENQPHDYWAEPHASVNSDLTRVLFTSNWGRSGTEQVDMYMINLPFGWLNTLP